MRMSRHKEKASKGVKKGKQEKAKLRRPEMKLELAFRSLGSTPKIFFFLI